MHLKKFFNKTPVYPLSISFYILLAGWTVIIIGIAAWSYSSVYSETINLAQREAFKGYEKDIMFRSWATKHGGVYVPVTSETQPNKYLEQIPERDITTPSRRKLTLMNPAYITRQVHELSFKILGIRGHITSLTPIRKENAADKWEIQALKAFEKGKKEIYGFDYINNEKYFRFMAPLITEKGCLKCHAVQGYKVGDIRGGISSTVPWHTYQASINSQSTSVFIGYGILWIIGFIGISLVKKRFIIYITRRDLYEKEMKKLNMELYNSKNIIEQNLHERNKFIEDISGVNEKLQKINSEKDKFFSIIAHDLKSPFNGFIGLTEIIADDDYKFSKDELSKLSKEIHFSAKNLLKLLQNLLEWSQMQKGMVSFAPIKINLSETVTHNIDIIKLNSRQKQITINLQVDDNIFVYADENMLNSIFRNLLSNAIKFSQVGGNVLIKAVEIPNGMVEISICDTGVGMSEELCNKLFKIEQKVGRVGTNGEQSTGLGLLLCYDFVQRHEGNIWVKSEEGKGTTFYFTLPVNK